MTGQGEGMNQIVSVDIGTTHIKVVKYKHNDIYYEVYKRDDIKKIINHAIEKEYDAMLLTGSGASSIEGKAFLIHQKKIPIYRFNELECVANVAAFMGRENSLVVNIGTGTSFVHYIDKSFKHITGTGIGGGTYEGLGERLLDIKDPMELQELARHGHIEGVNIVIQDIYEENLGWLQPDITVANFGKTSKVPEDVALGIHSIVIEPIISMVKGIQSFKTFNTVIFSGGVVNNPLVNELIAKYAAFFDIKYEIMGNPSFGTALGALEIFRREQGGNND